MSECPFCHSPKEEWTGCKDDAAQYYVERFTCGFDAAVEQRPEECYIREITDLKAKLEAWRDLADIVRPMDELKAVRRLDEMGEL